MFKNMFLKESSSWYQRDPKKNKQKMIGAQKSLLGGAFDADCAPPNVLYPIMVLFVQDFPIRLPELFEPTRTLQ